MLLKMKNVSTFYTFWHPDLFSAYDCCYTIKLNLWHFIVAVISLLNDKSCNILWVICPQLRFTTSPVTLGPPLLKKGRESGERKECFRGKIELVFLCLPISISMIIGLKINLRWHGKRQTASWKKKNVITFEWISLNFLCGSLEYKSMSL